MALNTGSSSPGELLMTLSTSEVAVCCSKDCFSSLSSLVFSIATTAWADLAGIAVHIGARVASLAEPGEVLVSQTVRDLVAGSGLAFETRGTHALKGVPSEWHLYRAVTG
jgi:hypothetical protein